MRWGSNWDSGSGDRLHGLNNGGTLGNNYWGTLGNNGAGTLRNSRGELG